MCFPFRHCVVFFVLVFTNAEAFAVSTNTNGNKTDDTVNIQVFYETLCPHCRTYFNNNLKPVLKILKRRISVHTYPFGNAEMKERGGRVVFTCQHGPAECYGNMLHACAIAVLRTTNVAALFNTCTMHHSRQGRGSDDAALDACGKMMGINTRPIKACAKGKRGQNLLKHFGDVSKKANIRYVPLVLVNGVQSKSYNLMRDVCRAFKKPPEACKPHQN